ncbi:MAG: alpha-glucosidase [Pseudomonadota bacterium]|nr:alpha-glucosidase [Pseudomonadota bacterium]
MNKDQDWWRGAVIYQIYPRSYCDSSGNGTGDLPGITSKMDYIASLGVDAIWLSPFQKSPMRDFGYDVSDYCDVDPLFGTLNDFDDFVNAAHEHDIKVIIDMVLSHTSDQHDWFKESRQNATNPKADWYVWQDPQKDGTPPNNWLSVFGGSAWQYCSHRGQYYLHNFLVSQPDLNLHNTDVQDAVLDACEFWLKRGVDGFRLDAISHFFHSLGLENNPAADHNLCTNQLEHTDPYNMQLHKYDKDTQKIMPFLKRIRQLMDKYDARMTVGEVSEDDSLGAAARYTYGTDMLNTCYNFSHLGGQSKKLTVDLIADPIKKYNSIESRGWPAWAFCNHDVVRVASRWGQQNDGETNPQFTKMLIALLTCLQGTVFIYQGEELGLPEAELAFEDLQDPWGIYLYPKWQGRDGCRTPMIWSNDAETNYGFSSQAVKPWLPISDKHIGKDAAAQDKDVDSVLNFTRAFLKQRKEMPALVKGDIEFVDTGSETLLAFTRSYEGEKVNCVFNLANHTQTFDGQDLDAFGIYIDRA